MVSAWLLAGVVLAQPTTPPKEGESPSEPSNPAAPASPERKAPATPFEPFFEAAIKAIPADWQVHRKVLSVGELLKELEADLDSEGKALCRSISTAEVMAANHPDQPQVCAVQILKFPEQKQSAQYLNLVHKITKDRFSKASGKKGATFEITDDKLNLFGPDSTRRLVIKNTRMGKTNYQYINRFIIGPHFVEVTSIAPGPEQAREKGVSEALVNAIRAAR
jgi:hypothetical protein